MVGVLIAGYFFVISPENMVAFSALLGIGLLLGILSVIPIGGADMPVVVSLLNSYSGIAAAATLFGVSKFIIIPLTALTVWIIILKCNYKSIEKIFLLLCFFYIAYIISGVMANPDWSQALPALITPSFSFEPAFLLLLMGIIGTTITPWMQFYLQSTVVEKGVHLKDYKYTKTEVIGGSIITDVVAFFIIIACAATLFANGVQIETAADAAQALVPFAGIYAGLIFGFGLFAASLAAAFIIPLATSFQICEGMGWESSLSKKFKQAPQFYSILGFLIAGGAIVPLIPNAPLLDMIIVAQVINGIALPFILIYIIKLINNKKLLKSHPKNLSSQI